MSLVTQATNMFNSQKSRIINTIRVLREIWLNREISRVDIANNLNLNKSTISKIAADLLEKDLIKIMSEGQASKHGGRKPVNLSLNRKYGCVLGLEIRPEKYSPIAVDLDGEIIFSKLEEANINGKNLIDKFHGIIMDIRLDLQKTNIPLIGIGVGISGVMNPKKGIIKYSKILGIKKDFEFYENIRKKFNIPIFIDNDANCFSWGELAFHRNKDLKNFASVIIEFNNPETSFIHDKISTGIGLVINSKVYYGNDFSAGEFMSVFRNETNKGQYSLSTDELAKFGRDKDTLIKFIREFSKNISLLVNTLNLGNVFLGGDIEVYRDEVKPILESEIQNNWAYTDKVNCEIKFSSLGDKAVAFGAAGMILDHIFGSSLIDSGISSYELGDLTVLTPWT